MKSVLISIKPKWCELIASGKKTVEVRKNRPKIKTPFKCYIYCTEGEALAYPHLNNPCFHFMRMNNGSSYGRKMTVAERNASDYTFANGKVIGEFVCSKIKYISPSYGYVDARCKGAKSYILDKCCLTAKELVEYGKGKDVYGWHISDLVIYDKPKELKDFCYPPEKYCEKEMCGGCPKDQVMGLDGDYAFDCEWERPLKGPPQSWCYVKRSESE